MNAIGSYAGYSIQILQSTGYVYPSCRGICFGNRWVIIYKPIYVSSICSFIGSFKELFNQKALLISEGKDVFIYVGFQLTLILRVKRTILKVGRAVLD